MERSSQNHFFCLQEDYDKDKVEKVNIVIADHIHFWNLPIAIAWKGLIVELEVIIHRQSRNCLS